MKVLVTGGSGFVGTNIVRNLLHRRYKVRTIDLSPPDSNLRKKIDFIQGDILDFAKMMKSCKGMDYVIHTVALVPLSRAGKRFADVNVQGTRNVMKAAYKNKVKKVVHISTSAMFNPKGRDLIDENYPVDPVGKYGRAKLQGEEVCKEYMKKMNVVVLRPRTLLGQGRLGLLSIFFDWLKDGKKIYMLGDGSNAYQLLSTDDLSEACVLALKRGNREFFNVGADRYTTLRKDLQALINYAGTGSKLVALPAEPIRFLLKLLDYVRLSPLVDWHYVSLDKHFAFDVKKAKKVLGWKARDSNQDMLINTYKWYLKNYDKAEFYDTTLHKKPVKEGVFKLIKLFS